MVEFYNVVDMAYLNLCKSQTLNVKVRVELLDHYENTVGEITTKVSTTGGSINVKYNQGVRRTCDITISDINNDMIPNDENSPLFVNKKFKIYIGLYKANYISNDDVIYWFSQGIFITKDCDYDKKNKVLHLTGVDKFGFFTKDLNQHTLQETYHINADSKLGKLISDIITISMGNGMPTDTQIPLIHTSFVNQVLPYDIEKTANETIGDILIEIATAFDADIYYDVNGHLVFEPNIIDDYNNQAPAYEFGMNDSSLLDFSLDFNYGDIVNQITVTGDNSDGVVYSSTATNENPISSLRVSNIGIKAADIEETAMGYSDKRCSDYANYLLKKKMRMAIAGTITCTPLPHLDCNKIVRVHNNENDVHETDFLLEEVQMPLSPEAYTLSVCNLQDLPLTCYTSGIPQSEISEWILFKNSNSVGKYINRSNNTFVVIPSIVNGVSITGIGGNGELEDGSKISFGSIRGLQNTKTLYIEDGIQYIYNTAFYGTYPDNSTQGIENIIFPQSLTSIGDSSFASCINLRDVILPDNLRNIGRNAFNTCINFTRVIIPSKVNSIGNSPFVGCLNLENIYVSEENNYYSSDEGVLFDKDKSLLIQYPIGNNKTSYSIPDSVINIGEFAFHMSNLENIIISSNVQIIGNGAFSKCENITNIILPISITSIGNGAFSTCPNLKNILIPNNVTSIGEQSFCKCLNLESITIENPDCIIPNWGDVICNGYINGSSYFNGIIYGYSNSTAQVYAQKYKYNFVAMDEGLSYQIGQYGVEVYASDSTIKKAKISSIAMSRYVNVIAVWGFDGCSSLTEIIIPDSIRLIREWAFDDCVSLKEIIIPNGVIDIKNWAFRGCSALKNISLGSIITLGDGVFANCTSLEEIIIPDSLTDMGKEIFHSCSNLTSVTLGKSITTIKEKAFIMCENLVNVSIPNNITSIEDEAFRNCTSLTDIIIPNSVENIGDGMFKYCTNLKNIYYTGTEEQWSNITKGDSWDTDMGSNVEGGTVIHYNYTP